MLDAQIVLWLIAFLTITTTAWSVIALYYSKRPEIRNSKLLTDRPLTKWWLHQMRWLVTVETAGLILLAIVQTIRNAYFIADDEPTSWLYIVIIQNILLFAIASLPATYLYTLVWGIRVIDDELRGVLNAEARAFVNLHRQGWQKLTDSEESK